MKLKETTERTSDTRIEPKIFLTRDVSEKLGKTRTELYGVP